MVHIIIIPVSRKMFRTVRRQLSILGKRGKLHFPKEIKLKINLSFSGVFPQSDKYGRRYTLGTY